MLPLLNSGRIVLPKSDRLVNQLTGLERRVSRSGKDQIDHGPNGHDDLANAVAGAADLVVAQKAPMHITNEVIAMARRPFGSTASRYGYFNNQEN